MNTNRIGVARSDAQNMIAVALRSLVGVINSELSATGDHDAPIRSVSISVDVSVLQHGDTARQRVDHVLLSDVTVGVSIGM